MAKNEKRIIFAFVFCIMKPTKTINIDDELSALWQKVYNAIVQLVFENKLQNTPIELHDCAIKSLLVDNNGVLSLTDCNGNSDFAENFEDAILYEVYDFFRLTIGH